MWKEASTTIITQFHEGSHGTGSVLVLGEFNSVPVMLHLTKGVGRPMQHSVMPRIRASGTTGPETDTHNGPYATAFIRAYALHPCDGRAPPALHTHYITHSASVVPRAYR